MMPDKDSERRRLHKLATSVWMVIIVIVATLIIDNERLTFWVLIGLAALFTAMLRELQHDIASLRIQVPDSETKRARSHSQRRPA